VTFESLLWREASDAEVQASGCSSARVAFTKRAVLPHGGIELDGVDAVVAA
jgi:hypothetical protein